MQFPPAPVSCEPPPLPSDGEEVPRRDTQQLLAGLLYLALSVPLLWVAWSFSGREDARFMLFWLALVPGGLIMKRGLERCRRGPLLPPVSPTVSWKAKQLGGWARKVAGISLVLAASSLIGRARAFKETHGINHLQLSLGCVSMALGVMILFIKGRRLREILRPEPRLLPCLDADRKPLSRRGVAMVGCGVLLMAAGLQLYLTFNGREVPPVEMAAVFLFPGMLCLVFGLLTLRRWFLRIPAAPDDWEPEEY